MWTRVEFTKVLRQCANNISVSWGTEMCFVSYYTWVCSHYIFFLIVQKFWKFYFPYNFLCQLQFLPYFAKVLRYIVILMCGKILFPYLDYLYDSLTFDCLLSGNVVFCLAFYCFLSQVWRPRLNKKLFLPSTFCFRLDAGVYLSFLMKLNFLCPSVDP